MSPPELLDFSAHAVSGSPFPHFLAPAVLSDELAGRTLAWLEASTTWQLTITTFYEQYEFSLLETSLPADVAELVSPALLAEVRTQLEEALDAGPLELTDITVHKLTNGHHIGVHNDYLGQAESHRLLVQLNADWQPEHGGYLLLFNSADAHDVHSVVAPLHNSAVGFEISPRSHHAVSTVYDFRRYTLVYTFKRRQA
jgi:Rps23 Pro-64 3,4-dihydroxylase Tpa1-like proline 4-hydroxylase